MGRMTLALVGAAVVVIALSALTAFLRRGVSERRSLRHYQNALDTLRTVSDRMEPPRGVGPVRRGAPPSAGDRDRSAPVIDHSRPLGADDPSADADDVRYAGDDPYEIDIRGAGTAERPLVFSDVDSGRAPARQPPISGQPPVPGYGPRRDRHAVADGPGPILPQVLGAGLAIIVLVVIVTLVTGGGQAPARSHAALQPSTRPGHGARPAADVGSTTTTATPLGQELNTPPPTASAASYAAPAGDYTLTLLATNPCWVYAKDTATSQGIWSATMESGQSKVITANGPIAIQFGSVNSVAVTINGRAVSFPSGYSAGFLMTFVPPTPPPSTASSTPTTAAGATTTSTTTSTAAATTTSVSTAVSQSSTTSTTSGTAGP